MRLDTYSAIATLVGTTIGAGVLGIPYVIAESGFFIGFLHILLIGLAVILINLYLGEITLRTKENHQISGYAHQYLGKKGKYVAIATMIGGVYGALIAYVIGVGNALGAIFGAESMWYSIGFWVISAAIVYVGLKAVKESEMLLTSIVILFAVFIIGAVLLSGKFNYEHLLTIQPAKAFVPFGVILFAFLGAAAIPEMKEELVKRKSELKKAILIGGAMPIIIYALFAMAVVGVGSETSEVATVQLGQLLGPAMNVIMNLFAVFAMGTSFLALGLALKEMYLYDLGFSKMSAWIATVFVPLAVFLMGVSSFIAVIGIVGAISGGMQGILIVLMHRNAKRYGKRKPEYTLHDYGIVGMVLITIFVAGMTYAVFTSFS